MFGNQPGGHSGRGSPWRPRAKHEDCRRYRSGDLRLCDLVSPMEVATESRQFVQARIFNLMYELQTIQRPSASLLIGARAR